MTDQKATVDFIDQADVGSFVWLYDGNGNKFDRNNKYIGRGSFTLIEIKEANRASLIHGWTKFDRKTGVGRVRNGFSPHTRLYGQKEYEAYVWMDINKRSLLSHIEYISDIDLLKQIAALAGYEEKTND